ncbi:SDR family oxidoreductase [Pseudonocardia kujensis]|uniref:SDR family NAD(P)-dependent oxidoreductase n=1 Tax=Pseudonocardia kujensis TaxID=1128675 RepID=UPI001E476E07|nr:SDR family NAD(P)-dependent oxidoreductase [Pseudonocardia kujensis]MCE0763552.1 SDR family oxidoreductase [Pseudonocardia kujensis]
MSTTAPLGPSRAAGRLAGRIALVTGGGGGCGRAIAQLFAAEDAFVLVADAAESNAKETSDSLDVAAEYAALDVRSTDDWAAATNLCRNRFGAPPDVLVNAADVMVDEATESAADDDTRLAHDVNAHGVADGSQAVTPGMRAPTDPAASWCCASKAAAAADIDHASPYFTSQESNWVTGTKFVIDGGMNTGPILGRPHRERQQ